MSSFTIAQEREIRAISAEMIGRVFSGPSAGEAAAHGRPADQIPSDWRRALLVDRSPVDRVKVRRQCLELAARRVPIDLWPLVDGNSWDLLDAAAAFATFVLGEGGKEVEARLACLELAAKRHDVDAPEVVQQAASYMAFLTSEGSTDE